jgi:aerobic carbon-monoxide dehydrogenase medium subunit
MIPPPFDYVVPSTLEEAVVALQERSNARPLAGGQSLIPLLKTRGAGPGMLVDIARIPELRGIAVEEDTVTIGPLTTHREIEDSSELYRILPIMRETADVLADPPVRSRGTFGGSLAFADPGGDWPAVALALNVRIEATGPRGVRTIPIEDFFTGQMETALESDELITRIDIPMPPAGTRMTYRKLRHPASGYALVGVAAVVQLGDDNVCQTCRIAVTGAGPKTVRATAAERALNHHSLTPETIADAAAHAADGMAFLSDIYAGEEYRAHLVRVYVERVLSGLCPIERSVIR